MNARYDNGWYYCWLIERRDLPQPEWWGGDCFWHKDANDALWFARKEDAEGEMFDIEVFVCEHGFQIEKAQAARPSQDAPEGIFGRTDLPAVMVYTARLQRDMSHECELGWRQVVLFGDHQRALDKVIAAGSSQPSSASLREAAKCEACNGKGFTDETHANVQFKTSEYYPGCSHCDGTGIASQEVVRDHR